MSDELMCHLLQRMNASLLSHVGLSGLVFFNPVESTREWNAWCVHKFQLLHEFANGYILLGIDQAHGLIFEVDHDRLECFAGFIWCRRTWGADCRRNGGRV
jgi:hypothetical protein